MKAVAASFAAFHAWALTRLLAAIAPLSDADYRRDCGLFFRSLHGTLNHLLVAERTWHARFAGQLVPYRDLAEEIEPDRAQLAAALRAQAADWQSFVAQIDEDSCAGQLHYRTLDGTPTVTPFGPTLLHVFTHGVHHRGQCTVALTALGHRAPPLDYLYFLRET